MRKKRDDYILVASSWGSVLLDQKINPIIQSSIRIGRNISQKVNFRTTPTPTAIEAIRKNIPMTNIMGIRKMLNISLYITSDTTYLGISIININSHQEITKNAPLSCNTHYNTHLRARRCCQLKSYPWCFRTVNTVIYFLIIVLFLSGYIVSIICVEVYISNSFSKTNLKT